MCVPLLYNTQHFLHLSIEKISQDIVLRSPLRLLSLLFIHLRALLLSALVVYVHIIVSPFIIMSLQEIYQVNWQQNNESLVLDMCVCVVAGCTHWCGKHCSVPKLRSSDPSGSMSCEPSVKEQKIEGRREEGLGEDCPLMCGDVYNLLNAARLLLFLNLMSKYHWPFSISIVTLTAVGSAHHNSLSGHSLAVVRCWNLGPRVCFTCLIYLKNTPAHSKRAIFFILQQNKSKLNLTSSVSAFSVNQIQHCMSAER